MLGKLWKKLVNRETISYLIFGVLTTLVDWISYWYMRRVGTDYRLATAGSWAAAVLFAFVTNKLFVFGSFDLHPKKVWSEFVPFVACRAATGIFTMVGHDCHGRRNGNQTGFYLQDCSVGYFSGTELHLQQVVYF